MGLNEGIISFLLGKFPNIKRIKEGEWEIEFYPPIPVQPQVQAQTLPPVTDMPPDDAMLFASTPTFDEMIDAAKVKE